MFDITRASELIVLGGSKVAVRITADGGGEGVIVRRRVVPQVINIFNFEVMKSRSLEICLGVRCLETGDEWGLWLHSGIFFRND